jgi:hypothetical protein
MLSHAISYFYVTAYRETGSRMNVQCAHMKSCSVTTQAQEDPSAGIIRYARRVSLSVITELYDLPGTSDLL